MRGVFAQTWRGRARLAPLSLPLSALKRDAAAFGGLELQLCPARLLWRYRPYGEIPGFGAAGTSHDRRCQGLTQQLRLTMRDEICGCGVLPVHRMRKAKPTLAPKL